MDYQIYTDTKFESNPRLHITEEIKNVENIPSENHSIPYPHFDETDEHLHTWDGFMHIVKWFTLHMLVDVIGILFILKGGIVPGIAFLIIGTSMLVYGIITTPPFASSKNKGTESN